MSLSVIMQLRLHLIVLIHYEVVVGSKLAIGMVQPSQILILLSKLILAMPKAATKPVVFGSKLIEVTAVVEGRWWAETMVVMGHL